jgi:uncharacterized protein (DUF58 family)
MPFDLKAFRNTLLGALLVLAGIAAALITLLASHLKNPELAGYASAAALLIVALILIFVVPPLMRSARLELLRLDLPLQVTKGGQIFLVVLLIVAFAAWNTGNNLLFLILSLLSSTLFVAWAAARAGLRDLVVSARFPDHIFASDPVPVLVIVKNRKRFWSTFSLLVEARNQETYEGRKGKHQIRYKKQTLAYFMYVPNRTTIEQQVEHTFEKRGHLFITGLEISTSFPFGFFRYRRRLRTKDVDLTIYPKPEPIDESIFLLPTNVGRLISPRRGTGHELFLLRDYQHPDDPRHIDWKATARAQQLIVREFTADDEKRIHIIFDLQMPADTNKDEFAERFERGVTIAASLVTYFTNTNAEICLTLGEDLGEYGFGQIHLYASLKRLAHINFISPTEPDQSWLDEIYRSSALINSSYVIILTAKRTEILSLNLSRKARIIHI